MARPYQCKVWSPTVSTLMTASASLALGIISPAWHHGALMMIAIMANVVIFVNNMMFRPVAR